MEDEGPPGEGLPYIDYIQKRRGKGYGFCGHSPKKKGMLFILLVSLSRNESYWTF